MRPLVSIVIPTFDRPDYLKEAVASALAQTYRNIEVLVGDNGETGLGGELAVVARGDRRFKYRQNAHNLGMSGNFNALADAAAGDFLVAIGDDDRLLPEFVSSLVGAMKPEARLAFCNHYLIDSQGRRLEPESREQTRRYGRHGLSAGMVPNAQVVAWRQSIALTATLMRTADMRRLRFREDLNTPDTEFFIRLAEEGAQFVFVPEYLAEYRVHVATETSSGLCSERLVEYLLPISVTPEVECYKRELLGPLLINAVSRSLRQGAKERAKRFLRSSYYPRSQLAPAAILTRRRVSKNTRFLDAAEHGLKSGIQHLCASLPVTIGCPIYRTLRAAKDWARGRRAPRHVSEAAMACE
jgi:glycosyltransferase involved in cell wall biosynthesis